MNLNFKSVDNVTPKNGVFGMYAFHLRPRGSNGTVAVRLIVVVWPVRSMHRDAVLVLLAAETSLSGSP